MLLLELFIWIVLILWIFWYLHVATERINTSIFVARVSAARRKAESSSGLMYWLGLVMYGPYLYPVRSFLAWFILVVLIFVAA